MKELKVTARSIRRANNTLVEKGIDFTKVTNYEGVLVTKTSLNGVIKVREVSNKKIKEAHEKSLRSYAEKL